MGDSTKPDAVPSAPTLGFLTVVEHEQLGLIGGYLILNSAGRPLEFHCTAPVKPSRAQQILFGPTLAPYLYGEQIAQTLIAKAGISPCVVWTDQAAVLSVREFVQLAVGLLTSAVELKHAFDTLTPFELGSYRAAVSSAHVSDRDHISNAMASFTTLDLQEPFGRIREALEEAQRAAGRQQAA